MCVHRYLTRPPPPPPTPLVCQYSCLRKTIMFYLYAENVFIVCWLHFRRSSFVIVADTADTTAAASHERINGTHPNFLASSSPFSFFAYIYFFSFSFSFFVFFVGFIVRVHSRRNKNSSEKIKFKCAADTINGEKWCYMPRRGNEKKRRKIKTRTKSVQWTGDKIRHKNDGFCHVDPLWNVNFYYAFASYTQRSKCLPSN